MLDEPDSNGIAENSLPAFDLSVQSYISDSHTGLALRILPNNTCYPENHEEGHTLNMDLLELHPLLPSQLPKPCRMRSYFSPTRYLFHKKSHISHIHDNDPIVPLLVMRHTHDNA